MLPALAVTSHKLKKGQCQRGVSPSHAVVQVVQQLTSWDDSALNQTPAHP